ncbi:MULTISPECIES: helix-turn-helix domain-containing protein [unclassified Mesorhizobium]|uniref:helix-turn-helix domain-containing protein n=1 Tax=unclassified Mesorhizobium TaxID=325217 RepID=UPI0003CE11B2|nr:helix-turn-helix domain-containing protein [Mesorhizobium sp. LSJC265A00]ESX09584.1 transcriptional regulator [Mesorhizobium sp. LSJC265A00]
MKIRTARDIGILIKEARTRRGLSQAALAKMINTTQTWVSWIENGKPGAEIGNVLLALTTLGVELDFQITPDPTSAANHHNADERHVEDYDDEIPYKL